MCGIAGTAFNQDYPLGVEVSLKTIEETISSIRSEAVPIGKLLKLAWEYKSNVNFLRLYIFIAIKHS